jgi:hypothetical protein
VQTERTNRTSFTTCETDRGEYEPFSRIWKLEGKDEAALLAARHYVEACADLGGRWVKFNTFTKRAEYLYMKQGYREEMTEEYTKAKTEVQNNDFDCNAASVKGDIDNVKEEGNHKGGPKQQSEDQKPPKEEEPKKPRSDKAKKVPTEAELKQKEVEKTERKEADKSLKRSEKTKARLESVLQSTIAFRDMIQSDEAWGWARKGSGLMLGDLNAAVENLESYISGRSFLVQWRATDTNDIKERFASTLIVGELGNMADLELLVSKVVCEKNTLANMHKGKVSNGKAR